MKTLSPKSTGDMLHIQTGNIVAKEGYLLKIIDNSGETVFETPMEKEEYLVDFSEQPVSGSLFVQVLDKSGNIMHMHKIKNLASIRSPQAPRYN